MNTHLDLAKRREKNRNRFARRKVISIERVCVFTFDHSLSPSPSLALALFLTRSCLQVDSFRLVLPPYHVECAYEINIKSKK